MDSYGAGTGLGELRATYKARSGSLIVNVILALVWFFLGFFLVSMLWDFYNSPAAAVGAGLFFLVTGLAYVIVPARRKLGLAAEVYEQGLVVRKRGEAQVWRFDQIDGIRVIAGQNTAMARTLPIGVFGGLVGGLIAVAIDRMIPVNEIVGSDVNRYDFYVDNERVLVIGPDYKRWKDLGAGIFLEALQQLVSRLTARIRRGESLTFDNLPRLGFGKTSLTLSRAGLQEGGGAVIPWSEIKGVTTARQRGFGTIETLDARRNITIGAAGVRDALVLLQVISSVASEAGEQANSHAPPTSPP
jgi:hypothetical protein